VGLGNPGAEFARTRHNAGADAIALLAERHGGRLRKSKERALVTEVDVEGKRLALAFPTTYMNDSGAAVAPLVRRFGIDDLADLVVVHDELDLPLGRIQVKAGGGLAGHNGLRSIRAHLHGNAFTRIRIGIGKPPGRKQGQDHVLSRPGRSESEELGVSVALAADAVECILREGVAAAQNRFNGAASEPAR
jgi:PTH1 family peptidyl-tRNA hydrolase